MTRGKLEAKDSKIREIYLSQLKFRRQDREKKHVNFIQLKEIERKLEGLKERASRHGQRTREQSFVDRSAKARIQEQHN